MTTINIQLAEICPGGNHLRFEVSVGARSKTVNIHLSDIDDQITDEELIALCKLTSKAARIGRTIGQARTLLQNTVVVTV